MAAESDAVATGTYAMAYAQCANAPDIKAMAYVQNAIAWIRKAIDRQFRAMADGSSANAFR